MVRVNSSAPVVLLSAPLQKNNAYYCCCGISYSTVVSVVTKLVEWGGIIDVACRNEEM